MVEIWGYAVINGVEMKHWLAGAQASGPPFPSHIFPFSPTTNNFSNLLSTKTIFFIPTIINSWWVSYRPHLSHRFSPLTSSSIHKTQGPLFLPIGWCVEGSFFYVNNPGCWRWRSWYWAINKSLWARLHIQACVATDLMPALSSEQIEGVGVLESASLSKNTHLAKSRS